MMSILQIGTCCLHVLVARETFRMQVDSIANMRYESAVHMSDANSR